MELTHSTVFASSVFLPLTLTRGRAVFLLLCFGCESIILGIFPAPKGCVPRRCIES
ncbi:unnamed protein product, partial [Ixodes pacificus]